MKIWLIDAFTNKPFTGNPAAVILVEDFPAEAICLSLSQELNLSETVFVKLIEENHYHIRWFTPKVEVTLCGHGTLAAAHMLFCEKYCDIAKPIFFASLSGMLKVGHLSSHKYSMDFPLQETGPKLPLQAFQALRLQPLCAVQADDVAIVEVSEEALRQFQPDSASIQKLPYRALVLTAKSSMPYDFQSRFFSPKSGVLEDPVTGSAHCKLAHYWQQKMGKNTFHAFQASSRGGEIFLQIHDKRVSLIGEAVTIFEGVIHSIAQV